MYTSNLKWLKREKILTDQDIPRSKSFIVSSDKAKTIRAGLLSETGKVFVNDIAFRLVLIPFFGIAIPVITKMTSDMEVSPWTYKLSFVYTIGLAWLVWEGNKFLLFTLRNYFDWFEKPMQKIGALVLVVPFYTVPVSFVLLSFWYKLFTNVSIAWPKVSLATAIILICVIFIVHVYETVFLVKEAESEKLVNARLEKSKAEAELQILKSQIDPHFVFNSLNTLSYLIDKDPSLARHFNQKLSDVYRYILQNRDRDFVFLGEEVTFVEDYFSMLEVRFGSALQLVTEFEDDALEDYLVLPISVQLLVENAVKHNEFSDEYPLCIKLKMNSNYLEVSNHLRIKETRTSSGLGLKNLDERCRLLIGRPVMIQMQNGFFIVKIPIRSM